MCEQLEANVVISDNAEFHHAQLYKPWRNRMAACFTLGFQLPYCPELKRIEGVWNLTRWCWLQSQCFRQVSELIGDVEKQFDRWHNANVTLRGLCARL